MEQFNEKEFEELWNLNPSGDKKATKESLSTLLDYNMLDNDDNVFTIKKIASSYSDYISWWNATYSDIEVKYRNKENKEIMLIKVFLSNLEFKKIWKIPDTSRTGYLFGGKSKEQLIDKYKKFLIKIKKRK